MLLLHYNYSTLCIIGIAIILKQNSADINLIILDCTENKIINKSFKPSHFWPLPSYVDYFSSSIDPALNLNDSVLSELFLK